MGWRDRNGWPLPVTARQQAAWDAWLKAEEAAPNRTDYYLMQITAELRAARGIKVDSWDQLKIPFAEPVPIKMDESQPHYPGVPRRVTQADLDKMAKLGRTFGGVMVRDMKRV